MVDFNIDEILKEGMTIKELDGLQKASEFLANFISNNELPLKDLIPLLTKLISFKKKIKGITKGDLVIEILARIKDYKPRFSDRELLQVAKLLGSVNKKEGIKYLKDFFNPINVPNDVNYKEDFESVLKISELYLKLEAYDSAFQVTRFLMVRISSFDRKFDFLFNLWKIEELAYVICRREKKYYEFLYYYIVAFILEIARDLISFPHLSGFFHRKEIFFNHWTESFNEAFDESGLIEDHSALINEIYLFTFEKLPGILGIPHDYVRPKAWDYFEEQNKSMGKRFSESDFYKLATEFKDLPFTETVKIHEFTSDVLEKYRKGA